MTNNFSKDPFTIDVTQHDFLASPLAIRSYHMIYGQPLTSIVYMDFRIIETQGIGCGTWALLFLDIIP